MAPWNDATRVILSHKIPEGFLKLLQLGRLDLTAEATVLRSPWYRLFDRDLLLRARSRLTTYYYADPSCPCLA
jgi:hypothetical protein